MLHTKLVREGLRVNVKVVERIYGEERLPEKLEPVEPLFKEMFVT